MGNRNRISNYPADQDDWDDQSNRYNGSKRRRERMTRMSDDNSDDFMDDSEDYLPEEQGRKVINRRRDIEDRLERQRLKRQIYGETENSDRI